jgi:hypothetical protein
MAHLRIPSHMSGEQYITKAALIADPSRETTVLIFPGTKLILRDYTTEAVSKGYTLVQLYNMRHKKTFTKDLEVTSDVRATQRANAIKMHAFLRSGIPAPERVTFSDNEDTKPETSGSTAAVALFYSSNPRNAESAVKTALLQDPGLTPKMRHNIEGYYFKKGFRMGEKYALFWGRKSGEATGAGPWLDTNEVMLAQMMIVIRLKDPGRKLVLIGDPVHLPAQVDGMAVPHPDINLIKYWDNGFPGGRDLSAQMFFIRLIRSLNRDTVSIGTNSGILELPHLMGIKTVYLENEHLHKRKGIRWQMLGANYRFTENPNEINTLRDMLEGARKSRKQGRIQELERKIQDIERHKVKVVHQTRPGLQRFSTTAATELWSGRKWLFGEVEAWLRKPFNFVYDDAHDRFLDLVIRAAKANANEEVDANTQRPAWTGYHDARKAWMVIRDKTFAGSFHKRMSALQAMREALLQHGLTFEQRDRFWETFNYTYLNQNGGPAPPDSNAAYRAWLKDTEEIWNTAKNRG